MAAKKQAAMNLKKAKKVEPAKALTVDPYLQFIARK
jgi:hypothetical protein